MPIPPAAHYTSCPLHQPPIKTASCLALVFTHRLVCEVEDVAVEEGGLALLHRHARLRVPEVGVRGKLI